MSADAVPQCPIPISDYPVVLLAHGGGGRLTHALIEKMFLPEFDSPHLRERHDGAVLSAGSSRVAFTTDSYVVRPLFFPGGDIGKLAVNGTVNDLAMCGARPIALSVGFIVEEGLPMETLWRVVRSIRDAARSASVEIVTGDTKVVDRGKGDGLYINTSGVGLVEHDPAPAPSRVKPGDAIIVSGDLGRHGITILVQREGLEFESRIESDTAPLAGLVGDLLAAGLELHCLRDLTRGGLAAACIEIAEAAGMRLRLRADAIPVGEEIRGACEVLGLDPLVVANEGRMIAILPADEAERAVEILRRRPEGAGAAIIGEVQDADPGSVILRTELGVDRLLDLPTGEQLPRIC